MKQLLRSLKIAARIKGLRLSGEKLLVVRGFTSSAQTTGNRSWPTSSPKTNFSRTGSSVRTAMYFSTIATESLESLGESISTAVLLSWSKSPGDKVEEGDVVATVETEKVTVDIRAKQKGVFAEALAKEKDEVKVGQNLYRMDVSPPDQPANPKQQQPGQKGSEKSKPSDSTTASSSTSGSSSGAVVQVKVPAMGESITGGTVSKWFFSAGDHVKEDEVVAIIETDKVNCDVRSPHSGIITKLHVAADADVSVDDELFELAPDDVGAAAATKGSEENQSIQSQLPKVASPAAKEKSTKRKTSRERAAEAASASTTEPVSSSSRENLAKAHSGEWEEGSTGVHGMERQTAAPSSAMDTVKNEGSEKKQQQTGRNSINRANPYDEIALKPKDTLEERERNKYPGYTEDVYDRAEPSTYSPSVDKKTTPTPTAPLLSAQSQDSTEEATTAAALFGVQRGERREKMSRLRQSVATRLRDSQNSAAMLTTFQETDMSALIAMRNKHKGDFEKLHGVKLGFMSAFVKASTAALAQFPLVNAAIDWQAREMVHRSYVDVSVAVQSPRGLVVPVLRDADKMSCAEIEKAIATFGKKAKDGTLTADEMNGGTFTISNGGVFGSLFSTPIINQPQSAILGMHATKLRPVVVTNSHGVHSVEARPMMYLALSYDHRLVDGRDAVVFLKSVSDKVEDPHRLLLGL